MNEETREHPPEFGQDWRQRLLKSSLTLPAGRMRTTKKAAPTRTITAAPVTPQVARSGGAEYLSVKGTLHQAVVGRTRPAKPAGSKRGNVDDIRADVCR